ncbi:MAG TPA: PQQ-binding-like beta-propeller repeat protein [Desulfomonilia bacterium]
MFNSGSTKSIILLVFILILSACGDSDSSQNNQSIPQWPMIGFNAQHTGLCNYIGPESNKLKWVFSAGSYYIDKSPVIGADGTVYIICGYAEHNKLFAINGKTGLKKWEIFINDSFGRVSLSIGKNGLIYIGSLGSKMYAFESRTGRKVWEYKVENMYFDDSQIQCSVTISDDGVIYFGANPGFILALNGDTGEKIWESETTWATYAGSPAIGLDGNLYVGDVAGRVRSLDIETGAIVWESVITQVEGTPSVGTNNILYVTSVDGYINAFNCQTGELLWRKNIGGNFLASTPAIDLYDNIYAGSDSFYSLNSLDGEINWEYPERQSYGSSIIDKNGTVYFAGTKLYAINGNDGSLKWEFDPGDSFICSSSDLI